MSNKLIINSGGLFDNVLMGNDEVMYNKIVARGGYNSSNSSTISINKVIFNDPVTVVYWSDNTRTIVKCRNEVFDREKGLAMAISKKAFGNTGRYNNVFKGWIQK